VGFPQGFRKGVTFHLTFAYEMLWSLIGVVLLLLLDRRLNMRFGRLFRLYSVIYSVGRAWIESIRIDPSKNILGLRINIWSAIVGIIVVQHYRHRGEETSIFRAQKVEEADAYQTAETK
jgi:prolipoprotein diacylglyceryltransferase